MHCSSTPHNRYNFLLCSSEEKNLYIILLNSFLQHKEKIRICKTHINSIISSCFEYINKDYPELFFVDFNHFNILSSLTTTTIIVQYHYSISEIQALNIKIYNYINHIKSLTYNLSSRDQKLKFIYEYIAKSIKYNSGVTTDKDYNILGPIINQKAVCEGYSKIFTLLCQYNNILSTIIFGESFDTNNVKQPHAWNIVKLSQNDCFQIDVTWESCSYMQAGVLFYDYFKQCDDDMLYDHFWDHKKAPPCKSNSDYSVITLNSPSEVFEYIKKCIDANKSIIKFRVTSSQASSEWFGKLLCQTFKKIKINVCYTYIYISGRNQINIILNKE